jgi:VWFA-related protein
MPFLTRLRLAAQIAWLLALSATCVAQMPPASQSNLLPPENLPTAPELPPSDTIRARVDEVNVVFTVADASGRFVSNLSLDDLKVLDNQRAPERISYFQQQSDLPLRVGLLVDLSASITEQLTFEKNAAIAFLRTVLRPEVDKAFLVGFASRVTLYQDFTSDIGALSQAVRAMPAGGDTRLYDAIRLASEKLGRASGPALMRRAIIIISDGEDTRSHALMYDAIQSALRAETVILALSSNDLAYHEYPRGEAVLELLARPTGGGVLRAHGKSQVKRAFDKVKETLHNQYALGYQPADFKPDGRFHAIEIAARGKRLRVQCRRGYFAPREEQESAFHATAP